MHCSVMSTEIQLQRQIGKNVNVLWNSETAYKLQNLDKLRIFA